MQPTQWPNTGCQCVPWALKSDIFGHSITPELLQSAEQHLTLSFYAAYTMAKYGMSVCALGIEKWYFWSHYYTTVVVIC